MFTDPLPAREVDQIARSIHRWITTKSRIWADDPAVYEATFSTIQSARGRKAERLDVKLLKRTGENNYAKSRRAATKSTRTQRKRAIHLGYCEGTGMFCRDNPQISQAKPDAMFFYSSSE
ncbi:hypothetical protein CIP107522_02214 [Corynebacterium diphtheriae]|nr:hypothetical protein [Corynebacterium diphtheriae]CAB0572498.1 hypothetical protein CIP107522_02214 [Corynebacterium diphtheriae]